MENGLTQIQNNIIERSFENIRRPEVFNDISKEIQKHVSENNLTTKIKNNNYPLVEAWQYAGALIGLFPVVTNLEDLSGDNAKLFKYRAEVEIYESNSGKMISRAYAICSNEEQKKRYFDEYAISSMAQTRATGKAFRLLLGWIFKASGYEATPAEEMEEFTPQERDPNLSIVLKEYKQVAIEAIKVCDRAADVESIVKLATSFKEDAEFLDTARDMYKELRNAAR